MKKNRSVVTYKMKRKSSAKKRFSLTHTGKIVRSRANKNHILRKKNSTRKRRLGQTTYVKNHGKTIMQMLNA